MSKKRQTFAGRTDIHCDCDTLSVEHFHFSVMTTLLMTASHVVTRVVTCGILRRGHGTWATRSLKKDSSTTPGPLDRTLAHISWGDFSAEILLSWQTLTAQLKKWPTSLAMKHGKRTWHILDRKKLCGTTNYTKRPLRHGKALLGTHKNNEERKRNQIHP